MFFRSEDEVVRWCERQGRVRGATVAIDVLFELSRPWYRDRLDPNRVKPSRDRLQSFLTGAGLTDEFWTLPDQTPPTKRSQ